MKVISALLVGGQGTYRDGHYYTEHPDRDLSVNHAASVQAVARDGHFTHVVCCGGYTQRQTPGLSEAESFEKMWAETQTRPAQPVILETTSLDSAENIIFGLMELRLDEASSPIARIGFYSQWQFKKPRMTRLAAMLGIETQFYFSAYTDHLKANASELARIGEQKQYDELVATGDFLLRGAKWEKKRHERYQHSDAYENRIARYLHRFPAVFAALDALTKTSVSELQPLIQQDSSMDFEKAIGYLKEQKITALQAAFRREVLNP